MTNADREKILDRVRKCLALSESSNEHEAALAAEKAQAILAEYNLSITDVNQPINKGPDKLMIDSSLTTDSWPWRRTIAQACAKLNFCEYYYSNFKDVWGSPPKFQRCDKHSFVGAEHNIAVAKMTFEYLYKTVERLAAEGAKAFPARERDKYRRSFMWAAGVRLHRRLMDRLEAAKAGQVKSVTTGTNLPALLSLYESTHKQIRAYMDQEVGKMGKGRARANYSSEIGARHGDEAGSRIGLDTQVGSSSQKQISH